MARPLRIEFPGALYHITSRGNAGGNIFLSDKDRKLFFSVFAEVAERYNWKCYAYCLMGNHYHLLVETPKPNLSFGMRQLNGVYTQSFNRIHNRSGHLFQGRFKAFVVDKQNYLLSLSAYIVLNPVRAGIVGKAGDWPWSSYNASIGLAEPPKWLDTSFLIEQFGDLSKSAINKYQVFLSDVLGDKSPAQQAIGQIFIGDKKFVGGFGAKTAEKKNQSEIPSCQRHVNRPELKDFFTGNESLTERNTKIVKAHKDFGYKQVEIAQYLSIHYATISRVVLKSAGNV